MRSLATAALIVLLLISTIDTAVLKRLNKKSHRGIWKERFDRYIADGKIANAAVVFEKNETYIASKGWDLKKGEVKAILNGTTNPSAREQYQYGDPITVNGVEYICFLNDLTRVYGNYGRTGIIMAKMKGYIIIVRYNAKQRPQDTLSTLLELGHNEGEEED